MDRVEHYLDQLKEVFHDAPEKYDTFLHIMKRFRAMVIDIPGVIAEVIELLADKPRPLLAFNTSLPPDYSINIDSTFVPNMIVPKVDHSPSGGWLEKDITSEQRFEDATLPFFEEGPGGTISEAELEHTEDDSVTYEQRWLPIAAGRKFDNIHCRCSLTRNRGSSAQDDKKSLAQSSGKEPRLA